MTTSKLERYGTKWLDGHIHKWIPVYFVKGYDPNPPDKYTVECHFCELREQRTREK